MEYILKKIDHNKIKKIVICGDFNTNLLEKSQISVQLLSLFESLIFITNFSNLQELLPFSHMYGFFSAISFSIFRSRKQDIGNQAISFGLVPDSRVEKKRLNLVSISEK